MLSGSCEGSLAVHDLENWTVNEQDGLRMSALVGTVSTGNRDAHKRSVESVQWYPFDTGIFTSSGTDRTLKIWDANRLQVIIYFISDIKIKNKSKAKLPNFGAL